MNNPTTSTPTISHDDDDAWGECDSCGREYLIEEGESVEVDPGDRWNPPDYNDICRSCADWEPDYDEYDLARRRGTYY